MTTPISVIHSHWQNYFASLSLSSDDFYSAIEAEIAKRKADIKVKRIDLSEGGLLSAKREYLRVTRKDYIFDICAAPFGTDFFVSWWFGEKTGYIKALLARIPFIGKYLAQAASVKTYYQIDTENMFVECVRSIVNNTVEGITKDTGIRLTAEELKPRKFVSAN